MEIDTFQKPEKVLFSEIFSDSSLGTFLNGFQSVIIYIPT